MMDLIIPGGASTVNISIINVNRVLGIPAQAFLTPEIPGTAYQDIPCLSFLIEHTDMAENVTRLLFDLGIRHDFENSPPSVINAMNSMPGAEIRTPEDVLTQLETQNLDSSSINEIIFSHGHFDHTGDPTRFPQSRLVVGPGFKEQLLPGYPVDPDSMLSQEAFEGRSIQELDFSSSNLEIASMRAIDWFGDGSFYLLDTPGHAIGHIGALARTTIGEGGREDTFILLGGDVCHHAGELRPSKPQPLPFPAIPLYSGLEDKYKASTEYKELNPCGCLTSPFYTAAPGGFNLDTEMMGITAANVAGLDGDPRVFVVLAHDHWLMDVVDFYPKIANDWKAKGWAERSRWRFLQDFV